MPYGFGRGRGFGRGGGGGWGFGLRGYSPPWPYVGLGRGGLPRHAYFFSGANAPAWNFQQPAYPAASPAAGYQPYAAAMTKEEELGYLNDQAEAIKKQLEEIDARMTDLEKSK